MNHHLSRRWIAAARLCTRVDLRAVFARLERDFLLCSQADFVRAGLSPRQARSLMVDGAEAQAFPALTFLDEAYPAALRELDRPPAVVWLAGRAELLDRPMLAVVGSRACTPYGRRVAGGVGGAVAQARGVLVYGAARRPTWARSRPAATASRSSGRAWDGTSDRWSADFGRAGWSSASCRRTPRPAAGPSPRATGSSRRWGAPPSSARPPGAPGRSTRRTLPWRWAVTSWRSRTASTPQPARGRCACFGRAPSRSCARSRRRPAFALGSTRRVACCGPWTSPGGWRRSRPGAAWTPARSRACWRGWS